MTTAPYRNSYGKDYGEKKPNEVFEANVLDISSTQFKNVKLLCTTDANKLLLPRTVKNLVVDSAYDLDTEYLTDGDYDTIHTDLYEPYNTDYVDTISISSDEIEYIYIDKNTEGSVQGQSINNNGDLTNNTGQASSAYVNYLPVSGGTTINIGYADNFIPDTFEYDKNKNFIKKTSIKGNILLDSKTCYLRFNAQRMHYNNYRLELALQTAKTPNIVPSASDGSLIFSMYAPHNTTEPASGTWDMKGLEFDTFHTFGLNNDVKQVYGYVEKSIVLEGTNLNWEFSYGSRDHTYILNNGFKSIAPLLGNGHIIVCRDKYGSILVNHKFIDKDIAVNIPVNTYEIELECYTTETSIMSYKVVYEELEPTQIQMPNRLDGYSYTLDNLRFPNEIASYTASDANTLPSFNAAFKYSYIVSDKDGSYAYRILADDMDNLPTQISFKDKTALLSVEYLDISKLTSMQSMFQNCSSLTSLDLSDWDTSKVANMSHMFHDCTKLTSLDLSDWDTSNVTDMAAMFHNCSGLTSLDLSGFDTSDVTNISQMFQNCSRLTSLDLSDFDTSNVTNMSSMFNNCGGLTSLKSIENWRTSKVANMGAIFFSCRGLTILDLSGWDISKVTNMSGVFSNCGSLQELHIESWPLNNTTQAAVSTLPVGNDAKNDIYASVNFTVPSGWTLINASAKTMIMGQNDLANLTDEEIAALINDGWTIG
jgi:surface protein